MAWSTEVRQGGYGMREETLTLPSGASTDVSSSTIDFLKPGRHFLVVSNTGATTITGTPDADLELDASVDGATFTVMVANLVATISAVTDAVTIAPEKTAAHGYAPYYRLRLDPSANTTGETITLRVLYPLEKPAGNPDAGFRINP
jgi:hypothetical protein